MNDWFKNRIKTLLKDNSNANNTDIFLSMCTVELKKSFLKSVIKKYISSESFNEADRNFGILKPALPHFAESQMVELLNGIKENTQTYCRGASYRDHREIITCVREKFAENYETLLDEFPNLEDLVDE